ncbi:hypothetical protein [Streptomyces sp. NPDC092129]|uniref:hypothetical protein n=1 Tax=Streptomyces sp. NPDC092129 TaxID=3366010 RepID=UPI00380664D3
MTARRTLDTATQADLLDAVPGIRLPDVGELRARGVLGAYPATEPVRRRTLGAGGRADEEPSHLLA